MSGFVVALHADAGHRVVAGEVLLELDPTFAALELRRSEAALVEARSRRDEARRLVEASRAAGEAVPERTRGGYQAEADALEATVNGLEAEVALARERLARHRVRAPFDGVVSERFVDPGEWVDPGVPVFGLVGVDRLRVDVRAPQERSSAIHVGQDVRVWPGSRHAEGEGLPGRVVATVPVNETTSRTFLVRIEVDDPDGVLDPGMSVEASLDLPAADAESGLLISRDAVVRYPDGSTSVWVVHGQGDSLAVSQRQVTIDGRLADQVEVRGLRSGVRVVVRGNERLREGDRVRIEGDE